MEETKDFNEETENKEEFDKKSENTVNDKATEKEKKSEKKKRIIRGKKSNAKELEKEIDGLTEKNQELKEKYLRLVAEYDNFRKRTAKEKLEIRETAAAYVLEKFLPVMDDLDRAMEFNQKATDIESVTQGLTIIYKKIQEFLKISSIEEVDAMHQEFDSDFHEAVTKIPAPSKDLKGKVVDVIQKGYKINDKVIRFPKVVVGE